MHIGQNKTKSKSPRKGRAWVLTGRLLGEWTTPVSLGHADRAVYQGLSSLQPEDSLHQEGPFSSSNMLILAFLSFPGSYTLKGPFLLQDYSRINHWAWWGHNLVGCLWRQGYFSHIHLQQKLLALAHLQQVRVTLPTPHLLASGNCFKYHLKH